MKYDEKSNYSKELLVIRNTFTAPIVPMLSRVTDFGLSTDFLAGTRSSIPEIASITNLGLSTI